MWSLFVGVSWKERIRKGCGCTKSILPTTTSFLSLSLFLSLSFSLSLSLHLVRSSRPQRKLTTKDPLVFHRGFRFLKFTRVLNIPSSAGRFDWRFDLMYEPLPPTPPSPPFPPLPPPPVVAGMKKHSVYLAEGLRRGGGEKERRVRRHAG